MCNSSNTNVGEPPQHEPGPLKQRSCTDVICLVFFLTSLAVWITVGVYAIKNGDSAVLLVPKDSLGRRCGHDSDVLDKPYLLFHDLTKCFAPEVPFTGCRTNQVCVPNCPTKFFRYSSNSSIPRDKLQFCSEQNGNISCPHWLLPSKSLLNRCMYDEKEHKKLIDLGLLKIGENDQTNEKSNRLQRWISTGIHKLFTINEHTLQVGLNVVEDIMTSWWKILIGICLGLLACIGYTLMMRWTAVVMVSVSIFGVVFGLMAVLYFTVFKYIMYKTKINDPRLFDGDKDKLTTLKDLWFAALIILSIVLSIILLVLIFLRKRLLLTVALITEGGKAVNSVTASLFVPIFPWILQVGVIVYAIAVSVFLASTGQPLYEANVTQLCEDLTGIRINSVCDPSKFYSETFNSSNSSINTACHEAACKFVKIENVVYHPYLQAFNVFEFFWCAFFVSGLSQMTLAGVFAQWYWTSDKDKLPFFAVASSLKRTLRYHIGTLAFGSLIITICRILSVLLEYLNSKLKKYENELTRAIMCMFKFAFYCSEKFLKRVNKNAYTMCAVHGKNFCKSTKDSYMLLMTNIVRVFVLDKVSDFVFFLSRVLLTSAVGALSYVFFATDLMAIFIDNKGMHYGFVPVIVIMISTYLISSLFFSVYSMAVDTLFMCFLEDCERNDGSTEKPYCMSKNLMKILGKKNRR